MNTELDSPSMASSAEHNEPFLGWRVVAAATVGLALGFSVIGSLSFGLFILPLSETFGWSRGDISVGFLIMNYTLIVVAPFLGTLLDRYGVRRVLLPSIVLFALAFGSLALLTENIIQFYFTYAMLTILGIGTIPASYTRVLIAWFDRRRGLAVGIAMAGVGVGGMIVPPYVQYLISNYGWQAGYIGVAILILVVSLPAAYFQLIEKPSDVGQYPDGDSREAHHANSKGESGFSFRESLRQQSFWLMVLGFVLLGFMTQGMLSHLVPLLSDRGVSPGLAAIGASTLAFSLMIGRVICGYMFDYFHAPRVVIAFLLCPVIGLAMLALGLTSIWAFVAVLLIGIGIGGELDFMTYLASRYLGSLSYGQVYGVFYAIFTLGGGIGSVYMGYMQDTTGSYDTVIWVFFAATVIALMPFARLGAYPQLPVQSDAQDLEKSELAPPPSP